MTAVRNITAQLPNGKYTLVHDDDSLLLEQGELVASLAKLKRVKVDHTPHGLHVVDQFTTSWLELTPEQIADYQKHLSKQHTAVKAEIDGLERRLSNSGYVEHAPAELVAESRKALADKRQQEAKLATILNEIN